MITTLRHIWTLSEHRHADVIRGLVFSFLRCFVGVTQLAAIMAALALVLGEITIQTAIIVMVVATLTCVILTYILSYQEQLALLSSGLFSIADKRVELGGVLRHLPLGFFTDTSTGSLIATLTTTLSGMEMAATMAFVSILSGLFTTVSFWLFMMFFDWRVGLIVLIGIGCYLGVVHYQMKISRQQAPHLQQAQRSLSDNVLTFLQGIKVTKAFNFTETAAHVHDAINVSRDENISLTRVSMPSQTAAHLVIAFFESAVLVCSLYLYTMVGDITVMKAIVLIVFSFMIYASLNQAGSILSMIGLVDSGLQEVQDIQSTEQLQTIHPQPLNDSHEIALHQVSFSYGDHTVLHNVTTTIKPQSLTAIIGPSGSGKTTLCHLIARFRDVTSGSITLGGVDVRSLDYDDLMKQISIVFQQVYLFEDTVANNIKFGNPDATPEQVIAAARAARCHDTIMALPQGYETVIGEGGNSLSGGEKQRISIARAMLKDAPIVILDEATSALDAENEHEIMAAIEELTRDKTVIMIAHKIQTIQHADHIIALRDGCVVQEGTPEELLQVPGLYADFVSSRRRAAGWQISNH